MLYRLHRHAALAYHRLPLLLLLLVVVQLMRRL
jgi:hypothetical protein